MTPDRQIRALFDEETITVYQAYSPAIAVPAAAAGTLLSTPFKFDRMTWIKPSFLWMMYRSGWATKPGQEHVLAVRITRVGFEEALNLSTLSHFDPRVDVNLDLWKRRKQNSPVRVQWDPERNITLQTCNYRSIQVGLSGVAADKYVTEWTVDIKDITQHVREIHRIVMAGCFDQVDAILPKEVPYPLPMPTAMRVGAR